MTPGGGGRRLRVAIDWGMDAYSIANGQYRYAVELLNALERLNVQAIFTVFGTRRHPAAEVAALFQAGGRWRWVRKPRWDRKGSHWVNQALSAAYLARYRPDIVHCIDTVIPHLAPCPVVLTLFDLMTEVFADDYAQWRDNRGYARYRYGIQTRVTRFAAASRTSAEDLTRFWGVPPDRIDVVYLGTGCFPPPGFAELPPGKTLERFPDLAGRPFVLSPYNLEPRKNLAGLLAALPPVLARHPGLKVALFGRAAWTADREADCERTLAQLGLRDAVVRLGRVSDLELADLYRCAEAFVFPSLYEGFGLPLAEAMAVGGCVVARGASAMAEVVGDAGLLVETRDPAALAEGLIRLLDDPAERQRLRERGRQRAATFTVERMARETFACYRRALRRGGRCG